MRETGRGLDVDGLVSGRHERKRVKWASEQLPEGELEIADAGVETRKGRVARALGLKDAALDYRRLFTGPRRRRARRLAGLEVPAKARLRRIEAYEKSFTSSRGRAEEVRDALGVLAVRRLSTRSLKAWKLVMGLGDTVGATLAYSSVFGVGPGLAVLLAVTTAAAFILIGTLAADVKRHFERARVGATLDELAKPEERPELLNVLRLHMALGDAGDAGGRIAKVVIAAACAGCVTVGVLRGIAEGDYVAAGALVVLAALPILGAAIVTWRHDNVFADVIETVEAAGEDAGRKLVKASDDRKLRRYNVARVTVDCDRVVASLGWRGHDAFAAALNELVFAANPDRFGLGVISRADSEKVGDARPEGDVESSQKPVEEKVAGAVDFVRDDVAEAGSNGSA